jgi:Sulfotransferase domain
MTHRAFQLYNVGIPKTGTTSIAGIFNRFRTGHEYMFGDTIDKIIAYRFGKINVEEFKRYLHYRDLQGNLEMDSASFNHYYLEILKDEFPDAKFIFTIRDCYSWLNSYLNMLLKWREYHLTTKLPIPLWQIDYGVFQFGDFNTDNFLSLKALKSKLPEIIERFLHNWSVSNANVLDSLPPDRSIIIRTHEISDSIPRLADFLKITENKLTNEEIHSNIGRNAINLLEFVDKDLLERHARHYCSDLMNRIFPEYTLSVSAK